MFFTYLRRELRRRSKQAIVVSIGLAIGIGLVMTVSSASAGVKTAQGQVLHSLYGVGTDMTVTKTASASATGPQHFGGFGGFGGGTSGSRPAAGTKISRDTLRVSAGQSTLPATDVAKVAAVHGVSVASGGLTLTDTDFSGTIPNFGSGAGSSGSGARPNFNISTTSVDGVQITSSSVGPLSASQITKGRYFRSSDATARVAVISSTYAKQHSKSVGSTVTVAGKSLTVIGIASVSSASAVQVYIPLGTAQALAGLRGDVSTIYVSATSAGAVSSVASAVKTAIPSATVTTSATLANEVTGSLSSASNLATNLGRWLSIAALLVAFLVAGLLMVAAVSRRVREFGTLKAIGWRTNRIVGQVMGEGMALGLAGGVIGLGLGAAGSAIVSAASPPLSATVGSSFATGGGSSTFGGGAPGSGFAGEGGFGGAGTGAGSGTRGRFGSGSPFRGAADATHTVLVHLSAPLQMGTVILAIILAIAGGLIAGGFGSWRAARLRPAAALRRIE